MTIKNGLVFAGVRSMNVHNEIISIANGMATIAQYDKYHEDKIFEMTVDEIRYCFQRGLAVVILER